MAINKEIILNTSVSIINEIGIDAFTMRKLANELDIKGASLYSHVKNKNEILEMISEDISKKALRDIRQNNENDIFKLALIYRNNLLTVRDSSKIFEIIPPFGENRRALIYKFFDCLRNFSIKNEDLPLIGNLINNYILSFNKDEQLFKELTLTANNQVSTNSDTDTNLMNVSPINLDDPKSSFLDGLNVIITGIQKIYC